MYHYWLRLPLLWEFVGAGLGLGPTRCTSDRLFSRSLRNANTRCILIQICLRLVTTRLTNFLRVLGYLINDYLRVTCAVELCFSYFNVGMGVPARFKCRMNACTACDLVRNTRVLGRHVVTSNIVRYVTIIRVTSKLSCVNCRRRVAHYIRLLSRDLIRVTIRHTVARHQRVSTNQRLFRPASKLISNYYQWWSRSGARAERHKFLHHIIVTFVRFNARTASDLSSRRARAILSNSHRVYERKNCVACFKNVGCKGQYIVYVGEFYPALSNNCVVNARYLMTAPSTRLTSASTNVVLCNLSFHGEIIPVQLNGRAGVRQSYQVNARRF